MVCWALEWATAKVLVLALAGGLAAVAEATVLAMARAHWQTRTSPRST
jgi:hypothetical protein